jgi:hypothetical protein
MSSPTSRSLEYARETLGWIPGVVERYVHQIHKKYDLFGCIDIIALCGDRIMGIQATSGSNHAARVAKALKEPRLRAWLAAGGLFEVWSWSKQGKRGRRKTWTLRRQEVPSGVDAYRMALQGAPSARLPANEVCLLTPQTEAHYVRGCGGLPPEAQKTWPYTHCEHGQPLGSACGECL